MTSSILLAFKASSFLVLSFFLLKSHACHQASIFEPTAVAAIGSAGTIASSLASSTLSIFFVDSLFPNSFHSTPCSLLILFFLHFLQSVFPVSELIQLSFSFHSSSSDSSSTQLLICLFLCPLFPFPFYY